MKITNIKYFIEYYDIVDIVPEDFALYSDYAEACDKAIAEIEEGLPNEIEVPDDSTEEDIADFISDETGWLVESYSIVK